MIHPPRDPADGIAVALDDLPRYSPWPARLLQPTPTAHVKSRSNVLREFNDEKWASLLAKLQAQDCPSLTALEALVSPPGEERVYTDRGRLVRAPASRMQAAFLRHLRATVEQYGKMDVICELGGGAGNVLLHLARHTGLATRWLSYELTERGREITQLVAQAEGLPVTTCPLDFDAPIASDLICSGGRALYYSSFALAYCRNPYPFLTALLEQRPAAVVLIEPIYQFLEPSSLLDLLGKRYLEQNDYSVDLWPAVQRLADEGRVQTVHTDVNFFGHNPLCPVSAIHLVPARR